MSVRILTSWALLLLGTAAAANAITFGEPDGTRHPYVGTILFRTSEGYFSCTGTLLSPRVMLTAAHCVKDNLDTWVKFTSTISFPGLQGSIITYLDNPANGWIRGAGTPHPQYTGGYFQTFDVGVVVLAHPVSGLTTFGALPPQGFLDGILASRRDRDNRFKVVGYGLQGFVPAFYTDIWERYQADTRLIELNSTFNSGHSAKFSNNPGNVRGGACYGDSGGPVFYAETNIVAAIVSWAITPCIGVDYQFRIDTEVALDFVTPFLQ